MVAEALQHIGLLLPVGCRSVLSDWGLSACSLCTEQDVVGDQQSFALLLCLSCMYCGNLCNKPSRLLLLCPFSVRDDTCPNFEGSVPGMQSKHGKAVKLLATLYLRFSGEISMR